MILIIGRTVIWTLWSVCWYSPPVYSWIRFTRLTYNSYLQSTQWNHFSQFTLCKVCL